MSARRIVPEPLCRECGERKPRSEFAPRKTGKRSQRGRPALATICRACTAERARTRVCRKCGERKPISEFKTVRAGRGKRIYKAGRCIACESAYKAQRNAEAKADPVLIAKDRARRKRAVERYRKRNAAAYKASCKRTAEKRRADPVQHARDLEDRRLNYRLKREREGKPVKPRSGAVKVQAEKTVPSAPIVGFIKTRIEQRAVVENFLGVKHALTGAKRAVLEAFGIDERTFYRWEYQQDAAAIALVERALLLADVAWSDVYSPEDHPDLYADEGVLGGLL